jgi:hypothetical protein
MAHVLYSFYATFLYCVPQLGGGEVDALPASTGPRQPRSGSLRKRLRKRRP